MVELGDLILLFLNADDQKGIDLIHLNAMVFLISLTEEITHKGKVITSQELFDEFDILASWEMRRVKLKNKYQIVL